MAMPKVTSVLLSWNAGLFLLVPSCKNCLCQQLVMGAIKSPAQRAEIVAEMYPQH